MQCLPFVAANLADNRIDYEETIICGREIFIARHLVVYAHIKTIFFVGHYIVLHIWAKKSQGNYKNLHRNSSENFEGNLGKGLNRYLSMNKYT